MSKVYDMIIIGGGPAGYTAALYGARAGLDTVIIEKMTIGGQMTETGDIDNYPGFDQGIDGITLGMKMQAGAEKFGANTIYDEVSAVSLSGEVKKITTAYSGELESRAVIIATGASPRRLGLSGEENLIGQGIHYCAHCDGRFYKGKTVAVVGGGNTALEDALYLSGLADRVYLIHRRNDFRASAIYRDAIAKTENVACILASTVTTLESKDGRLTSITLTSTEDATTTALAVDALFVSIGRIPNTAPVQGLVALDESGYVIADETTRTSVPGVFAIGDIRQKPLRQVVTAAADGAVAAHFAEQYLHAL